MKEILKKEEFNYYGYKIGLTILENEPQYRTCLVQGKYQRLKYPYVQFSISYFVSGDSYIFGGQGSNGLKVTFSKEPVRKIEDIVNLCPFEYNVIVCTPHSKKDDFIYDGKAFDSLEELQKCVVNSYFSLNHEFCVNGLSFLKWTQEKDINGFCDGLCKYKFSNILNDYCYDSKHLVKVTHEDKLV